MPISPLPLVLEQKYGHIWTGVPHRLLLFDVTLNGALLLILNMSTLIFFFFLLMDDIK